MNPRQEGQKHEGLEARAPGPTPEVIARLAELIREREGGPKGRDQEFRRRAEAELQDRNDRDGHDTPV